MPRTARKKSASGIYHIMVRSISEVTLFKNSKDKDKYLEIIKKYKGFYLFDIYAYCLMNSHAHIIIDCCMADISKIMKSINQSYSSYYNYKYNRHGHVFQDRFKSKIIDNDNYLMTVTAYIHNNPKDIKAYTDDVSKYPYSSLGIFLGRHTDKYGIVNHKHILDYFSKDIFNARKTYIGFIQRLYNIDNIKDAEKLQIEAEFLNDKCDYRSERNFILRNLSPDAIVEHISKISGTNFNPRIKHIHSNTEFKALFVIIMRSLSDYSLKDICLYINNNTLSNIWKLSEIGFNLISKDAKYNSLFKNLISTYRNYIPAV